MANDEMAKSGQGYAIFTHVGGGSKYFYPCLGKIPNLTNIFQMGWNHQLVIYYWQKSGVHQLRLVVLSQNLQGFMCIPGGDRRVSSIDGSDIV